MIYLVKLVHRPFR